MLRKKWIGPEPIDPSDVARLVAAVGVTPAVARILIARGKSDPAAANEFLNPDLSRLSSPRLLLDADAAIDRLLKAVKGGERILVFGDFDVDGVTSTSLAVRSLRSLGADVDFLLPKRLVHGYGLSMNVLPEVLAQKPAVVLTVDCGIRSLEEVDALAAEGVDTIITDHHEPGPKLPNAVAVVDPKREGDPYPDKRLAGVGVIYQLLRGLTDGLEHELDLTRDLDLVTLGTVADVVPLDGENRILVSEGLDILNQMRKIGVMALVQAAGVDRQLETWHLAYQLGPRINAAGRLGDAADAVRLFISTDTAEAANLARRLDEENRRRQEVSQKTLEQSLAAIERGTAGEGTDGIVLASDSWHPGVIGIATAKLVERFHRPAALIAMDGDTGRGSVRSIPGIDVCSILDECQDLLVQYGGHEMAAGLTLARSDVAVFRERFSAGVASRLDETNSVPKLSIDGRLAIEEVDLDLVSELDRLGPFGYGNRRPTFLVEGARLQGTPRIVGRGHLKMSLTRPGAAPLDCIGFDLENLASEARGAAAIDVVGHVSVNEWNGRRIAQLQVLDLREAMP